MRVVERLQGTGVRVKGEGSRYMGERTCRSVGRFTGPEVQLDRRTGSSSRRAGGERKRRVQRLAFL